METTRTASGAASSSGGSDTESKRLFWKKVIRWSIAGIIIPLLVGVSGTVIGMLRAFSELSGSKAAEPTELADAISASMSMTMFVLPIVAAAVVCLVVAVKKHRALTTHFSLGKVQ